MFDDITTTSIIIQLVVLVFVLATIYIAFQIRKRNTETKILKAEEDAKRTLEDASKEAEAKKKEAILEAKEEVHKLRADLEKESRERRNEIQRLERRNLQREESLDKKSDMLEKREETLSKKLQDIQTLENGVQELYSKQREELERISGLTLEEAKDILLHDVEKKTRRESALLIKRLEAQAKEESDKSDRSHVVLCAKELDSRLVFLRPLGLRLARS